jgi:D-ribose pyranose/furanose isomerase RbsD
MVKKRKSSNQLEKDSWENCKRMSKSIVKKMEEQNAMEIQALQKALKKRGITQEFNYADHTKVCDYANHAVEAQIETVDASIAPL